MIWQFSLYAVSTLCGGIFALVVAFFAWKRRKIAGGLPLALLMLAVSIWSIANGLENAAVGFAMKLLCGKIAYLGIALAPFMFLLFSLAFLQHQHRISWTMIALFLVIPVTTIGLVFSNEWHHLVWSNITYNSEPGTNILLYQYGPWFWIHAIYVYILIFVSIFLLIRTALRSQQLYRQQSIAILFSTPLPIISNFLYLSGLGPLKGLDLTPIAFSLGGMILTWSIYSLQMFDFLPIAHEKIIENLSDGVIVLDNFNRVVDINANALEIIRKISEQHSFQTPSKVIGEPVENIFAMLPDISNRADEDSRIEMRLGNDKGYQDYELHVSPVSDAKEISLGHILTLYDITKRKHAEEAEHEQRILSDALRNIASALNGTLDLDEVLDRILENIGAVVPHDLATIMLIDEEGIANVVRHRGYREHNLENIIELIHLPVIETPTLHQMMDANVPVLVADTRVDNNWVKIKETEHELSYVGTPIRIVGETVGFINLVSMSPGFFTAHHADRLLAFSDQAAIAIENARLFSKAQKYAQEAEVLHAVGMAINSSLEFEQILDLILEQINTVIPSDTASITLIEKDEVVLKAVRGKMILKQVIGKRWKMRNTPAQQVFEVRHPMRFPDVQVSYESYRPEPYSYIKSVLIIPLFVKEDVIGFLYLDSKELGSFTTDDERVASVFATHVAIALENSRLYTETQRRLVEQSILNEIIHSISSKLNLSELIELVYQQINRFIDAQCFMIVSYNTSEENWQVTFEQGVLGTKEGFHTS
ncbi:MAG: histidine kinase N-terminal 7TM domain-containing protein, partial [Chloroflexota bacterium]